MYMDKPNDEKKASQAMVISIMYGSLLSAFSILLHTNEVNHIEKAKQIKLKTHLPIS